MSGRETSVAVVLVEALAQGAEKSNRSSRSRLRSPRSPSTPRCPWNPSCLWIPRRRWNPSSRSSRRRRPVPPPWDVPPLFWGEVVADAVGDEVDVDTVEAPSSRAPCPSLHAVSVSVTAVSAAAASMRVAIGTCGHVIPLVRYGCWCGPPGGVPGAACLDDQSLCGDPSQPPQLTGHPERWNACNSSDLGE
ncbi:hypothetical protein SALBM311S_11269 [Streptomyces alboniger]